jgi:hypothetical protein
MLSILLASALDPTALDWADRARVLDPDAFLSRFARQLALASMEAWDGVIAESAGLIPAGGQAPTPLVEVQYAGGLVHRDKAAAQALYHRMVATTRQGSVAPMALSVIAMVIGDRAEAVRWLRVAQERKDPQVIVLGMSGLPVTRALAALPEFQAVLDWMKLPAWVERGSS